MKKRLYILIALSLSSEAVFAASTDEVRQYLTTSTQIVQKHLDALAAAGSASAAAAALNKYAADMKPVMKKSHAIRKRYPDFANDESVKTEMEAMGNAMMQMNQRIGEARQKYGKDRKFKQAEKNLQKAGLFGAG